MSYIGRLPQEVKIILACIIDTTNLKRFYKLSSLLLLSIFLFLRLFLSEYKLSLLAGNFWHHSRYTGGNTISGASVTQICLNNGVCQPCFRAKGSWKLVWTWKPWSWHSGLLRPNYSIWTACPFNPVVECVPVVVWFLEEYFRF